MEALSNRIPDIKFIMVNTDAITFMANKDCKDDITEYTFIEGKEYKIEMKTEEIISGTKKYYYLEGGTFYKISRGDDDKTDISGGNHILVNQIIYLILSILLFLN